MELLKILVILEYIPIFFSKRPLSSFFNVVECKAVSIGTLFHPGATLKLGEAGKFRKYSKVPIYFVQSCSLLGHLLSGKWIVRAGSGNKKGKGIVRAGCGEEWDF